MDEIDKLGMKANLVNEICGLNHGHWDCPDPQAVDYIVAPFGYKVGDIEYMQTQEFAIPVCKCCAETLYSNDKEWILYYCINCNSSQWIIRQLMGINSQRPMVEWLDECPKCKAQTL